MIFDHSEKHFGCIQQSQSCKTFPPIITLEFCSRLSQLKLYFRIVKTSLPPSPCGTMFIHYISVLLSTLAIVQCHEMHTGQCPQFSPMSDFDWNKVAAVGKCFFLFNVCKNILVFIWSLVRD